MGVTDGQTDRQTDGRTDESTSRALPYNSLLDLEQPLKVIQGHQSRNQMKTNMKLYIGTQYGLCNYFAPFQRYCRYFVPKSSFSIPVRTPIPPGITA